ncbi:hypothetical protein LXA43DRAFT_1105778 [Ganoderma leucocontextum]|nr:hypothetical protein LXA43DRAFT_1105778 [Ganoderma leucocontextum]
MAALSPIEYALYLYAGASAPIPSNSAILKVVCRTCGLNVLEGGVSGATDGSAPLNPDEDEELLEVFMNELQAVLYVSAPEYPAMIRFFAHFRLFMIDVSRRSSERVAVVTAERTIQMTFTAEIRCMLVGGSISGQSAPGCERLATLF